MYGVCLCVCGGGVVVVVIKCRWKSLLFEI